MTSDREASQNEPDPVVAAPRRGIQFSLATLMRLTFLAVCLAALCAMYRDLQQTKVELQAARAEVRKYRDEMGYLDISDPNKIYARGFRTLEENRWSWRIYLPEKPEFRLVMTTKQVSKDGVWCYGSQSTLLEPGEHLVDVRAGPGPDGKWRYRFEISGGGVGGSAMEPLGSDTQRSGVFETRQEAAEPGSRLELLRLRKCEITQRPSPGTYEAATDPRPWDGFMIWIEQQK